MGFTRRTVVKDEGNGDTSQVTLSGESPKAPIVDALDLQLGVSATKKQFGMLNLLSLAFVICNSWVSVSGTVQLAIAAGGPRTLIYSILVSSVGYLCIACSLAELASVYPTAGGQYHFASILAPESINVGMAYTCGLVSVFSWVAIGASVTIIPCQTLFAVVALLDDTFVTHKWQIFLLFQAVALVIAVVNIFALKRLPWIHNIGFFMSLGLFLASIIITLVRASPKASSELVWKTSLNFIGWPDGMSFLIGLSTSCYMFIGVDAAMHLAEECVEPRRFVPKAILGAILIGFLTAFAYSIVSMYGIENIIEILTGTGYIPVTVLTQNFRSKTIAAILTVAGIVMSMFILNAIQETSSRLAWSFARDDALYFSDRLQQIHPKLQVPVYSIIATYLLLALCGCMYMASSTAFGALISTAVVLQQLSFIIPIILLMYRKRSTEYLPSNRAFRVPNVVGWVANTISVIFCLVTSVVFNLPIILPTTASSMNYTCVILAVAFVLGLINWFLYAKSHFHGPRISF
ncbi:amino acid permease family protein [Bisporella sp. PMI_857]|nr:amino acid permease family protein [Bisporella sp. PMI_857]